MSVSEGWSSNLQLMTSFSKIIKHREERVQENECD